MLKFTFGFFGSAEPELAEQEKLKSEKEAKNSKSSLLVFFVRLNLNSRRRLNLNSRRRKTQK
jgi:hypothetical protein